MTTEQIIGIICAVAPTLLAALFASKWWKEKTGRAGAVIEAAALAAVEAQNRERVNAARSDPDSGGGVGSVPVRVGKVAKVNAMTDAITAIAHATNTPAGEVVEKLAPVISQAIESGVEAIKRKQNPDLPAASLSLFPDSAKMVLLFVALSASLSACQSLPDGWKDSNAANLDRVALSAAQVVYAAPSPDPAINTLAEIGNAGEAQYLADAGTEKQARVRTAAREMLRAAKAAGLPNWKALATSIRETCQTAANDADQILGLLLAAIRTPKTP